MSEPAQQPKPWDRQPDEPALWFSRFDAYRLLGPKRSVTAAWNAETGVKVQGKEAPSNWYQSAKKWRWQERAEAWDAQELPSRQQQQLAELAETRARHREMSRTVQDLALKAFERLQADDLSPLEALRYFESGVDLERKAIEEPLIAEVARILEEIKKSRKGRKK